MQGIHGHLKIVDQYFGGWCSGRYEIRGCDQECNCKNYGGEEAEDILCSDQSRMHDCNMAEL